MKKPSQEYRRFAALWTVTLLTSTLLNLAPAMTARASTIDGVLKASSRAGIQATLRPASGAIVVGERARWLLTLNGSDGSALEPLSLAFDGNMPEHAHGFPEPAAVTSSARAGVYEIYPVRFNMNGRWLLTVSIGMPDRVERIVFDLNVTEGARGPGSGRLSAAEIALARSLSLNALPPVPRDPTNRFSLDDRATELGRALFFDAGLSRADDVACASCHQPGRLFTDGLARSRGSKELARNAPSLVGAAYGQWYYWDGRRDSLWSQALTPVETAGEMDSTRVDVVRHVTSHADHGPRFRELTGFAEDLSDTRRFPAGAGPFSTADGRRLWEAMSAADKALVDGAFADIGKALAAFEESLAPPPTRFDRFVDALSQGDNAAPAGVLTETEITGLKLFLDVEQTQCLRCHNGPLLTNHGFHAIGSQSTFLDLGFLLGLQAAQVDPFNCTGPHSDRRDRCGVSQMAGMDTSHLAGAFKVPSLRYLNATGPYFHDGRFATLEAVMGFYTDLPTAEVANQELTPLTLEGDELAALIAFLGTLSAEGADYSSMAR